MSFDAEYIIDHSKGRAQLLNGTIFYSPNCSRDVNPPPPRPSHHITQSIFKYRAPRLHHFQTPQWWTAPFGYLSFLPLRPSFTGYPLDRLAHIPPLEVTEGAEFQLNRALAEGWFRLEQRLAGALSLLSQHCPVAVIRPFYPSAWGYARPHPSHYFARQRAVISRDWFVIFLAGLSFMFAVGNQNTDIPDWFTKLAQAGYDQTWLTGIGASQVGHFSASCPRVGIILDFVQPEKTQPYVTWFCDYHVPVWYPWTNAEVAWVSAHVDYANLIPPPHKLQAATTFMTRQLSGALPTSADSSDASAPQPEPATLDPQGAPPSTTKPSRPAWEAFFEERDRLNARMLENENEQARQTRLNRERQPPTISAPVFEWVKSQDDPTQLVRQAVLKSARGETLDNYSESQRRYDSFWNEWDCCEEFGPYDKDPDDEGEGFPVLSQVDADQMHDPPIRSDIRSPSPPPITERQPYLEEDPNANEVLHALFMHYGFVPPLTVPDEAEQVAPGARETFSRITGLPAAESVFTTSLGKVVCGFIQSLAAKQNPDQSLWDLRKNNRDALAFKGRVARIRRLPCGIIFFDFGQATAVPWKIAPSQPGTALYICRLDPRYDEVDIARNLLQRGISFRTLLLLKDIPSPVQLDDPMIPIRLPGHKFSKRDYDAYLHQRAVILSGRGGRAALLQGGILWRLAMQETSFNSVIQGPSSSVLMHRAGISYEDPLSGNHMWDDELSNNEAQLLCGAYLCYTGNGNQTALLSWFPLPLAYDRGSPGHWTALAETQFQAWLTDIENGGQPKTQSQWRNEVRGGSTLRKLKTSMSSLSLEFLDNATGGGL